MNNEFGIHVYVQCSPESWQSQTLPIFHSPVIFLDYVYNWHMGIIGRSVQYDHQIDLINIGQSYIPDKSSNRPLRFCPFSSKPKSALQLYLHLQIGWCVSQIRHKKVLQNSEHCMQDAPMNTGTTIFKIHKIQHFVTICQKSLKYPNFMSKTTSLL